MGPRVRQTRRAVKLFGGASRVELLGHSLVLTRELVGVDVGEAEDTHVRIGPADLRAPEADVLDRRYDAGEESRTELAHDLRGLDVRDALLDREPERLPPQIGRATV